MKTPLYIGICKRNVRRILSKMSVGVMKMVLSNRSFKESVLHNCVYSKGLLHVSLTADRHRAVTQYLNSLKCNTVGCARTNDATTNDATTNDATTNDAATNDATTNDATTNDATANDATTNDATTKDGTTNECYNEQFLSIKSGCYNERGGILSADVARACA